MEFTARISQAKRLGFAKEIIEFCINYRLTVAVFKFYGLFVPIMFADRFPARAKARLWRRMSVA